MNTPSNKSNLVYYVYCMRYQPFFQTHDAGSKIELGHDMDTDDVMRMQTANVLPPYFFSGGPDNMETYVYLQRPTVELRNEYLSFYQEWKACGETMVPWVISKDPSNFPAMIQFLFDAEKEENLPEGLVPGSTYWLVSEEKRVIGAVNIRHRLNEALLNAGGHIGYGIRPSERRKGYATRLLSLALGKAKELGIACVLVVCDDDNIGSEKIIVKNGGVQDTSFVEEDGNIVKRFWIRVDPNGACASPSTG